MDAKRVNKHKHVAGSPPTQMQPSQANIMPGHSRVRGAQALRDERAYLKAQAAGASVNVLDRLRRKALPSWPCLDCGRRMACVCCDKEELSEQLLESYTTPPAKFEKAIQADVLADQLTETIGEDKKGPTQEEILAGQLRDSQQQEDFLRKRIKKKVAEMDELRLTSEDQVNERTQQRDEFEAEAIRHRERADTAENMLAKLQTEKETLITESTEKLQGKQAQIVRMQENHGHHQILLTSFLRCITMKGMERSIMIHWHWVARLNKMDRAADAILAAKDQEMREMKARYEKQIEDDRLLQSAQAEGKREEFESTIAERDKTITLLQTELGNLRAEFQDLQQHSKAEVELLKQRNSMWEMKHNKLQAALDDERGMRDKDREAARLQREALEKEEDEQIRKNRRVAQKGFGSDGRLPDILDGSMEGGFDALPPALRQQISDTLLRIPLARIKELETRLEQAEQEYNIVATFLDKCQHKVLHLRQRLHAEVQYHLDSQAKYHKLNKEREDLELKILAQRRCMGRNRVTKPEVECRALGMKNEKLVRHIDLLRDRLGAVKKIANSSSEKNIRWAIKRAAGTDDAKARRVALFESLDESPVVRSRGTPIPTHTV
eukprot:GEMP01026404.1.p1 GENE.GEMP01026404.1~~GEMP01026404.1.p1  ORF type:complete len:609 (+),score=151.95 GEMP01026404.1:18-1844(+)